jgi:putative membrane protein
MRMISCLFAAAASVPSLAALADQPGGEGGAYHYPMMWGGWGWSGMIFGPLMMIAVLAAIIVVAVLVIRWLGGSPSGGSWPAGQLPARTALDILKERFAKGEIDKEEFEERRRLLSE